MAENNTSAEYNPNENFDFESHINEDIGDDESKVPDSDPDSLDIEVSSTGSSDVSSEHTDFGDEEDDNGPDTSNNATVTPNENIHNWNN